MTVPYRRAMLLAAAIVLTVACASLPPIAQDPRYHSFAGAGTLFGIPNFWNVVSNVPFLVAAIYGLSAFRNPRGFAERWEGITFAITMAGTAGVAAGFTWYHLNPTNDTLLWDRLPMTVVFASLLTATIGERIDPQSGRHLLFPLLGAGILSVFDWRITGDLRAYAGVQFGSAITIAFLLAMFPARYTRPNRLWFVLGFYAFAKLAEQFDRPIAALTGAGGHPWKHVLAAAAVAIYARTVGQRRPLARVSQCETCGPD